MTTFKDLEDNLKSFLIQEQSDAHSSHGVNVAKYNNIKIWMSPEKIKSEHFFIKMSISEACFNLKDCSKINGGLGYEERFIIKWYGRMGIKQKLEDLWKAQGDGQ